MLKGGIFLDMNNLVRNGGWGLDLKKIKKVVESQGVTVLRANAYVVRDHQKEREDLHFREKNESFRENIRQSGFHVVEKNIKRYWLEDGTVSTKSNSDFDMAIDVLLQSNNLDYILLGTGEGDFVRVVRSLQDQGKRVDVLAFSHVNRMLKMSADYYFPGSVLPGVLSENKATSSSEISRGILGGVCHEKGFGFITIRTGYEMDAVEPGVFCHISELTEDGEPVSNDRFSELGRDSAVIEFEKDETEKGTQAINAVVEQSSS